MVSSACGQLRLQFQRHPISRHNLVSQSPGLTSPPLPNLKLACLSVLGYWGAALRQCCPSWPDLSSVFLDLFWAPLAPVPRTRELHSSRFHQGPVSAHIPSLPPSLNQQTGSIYPPISPLSPVPHPAVFVCFFLHTGNMLVLIVLFLSARAV